MILRLKYLIASNFEKYHFYYNQRFNASQVTIMHNIILEGVGAKNFHCRKTTTAFKKRK